MQTAAFTLHITEDGSNLPERFSILLSRYVNGQVVSLDTIVVNQYPFTTEIQLENSSAGLFFLTVLNEKNRAEFIWAPTNDDMRVESNYWSLRNGFMEIANSPENQAYAILINAKNLFDARLEDLEMRLQTISAFDKDYKHQVAAYEDSIEFTIFEFNIQLQALQLQFPNTFTAKTLVGINQIPSRRTNSKWTEEYDGYLSLMNEHFFDFIPLNDPNLLNHYALEDKIVLYLDRYTLKTTDGAEKGIDVIMNAVSKNTNVASFVYNLLLRNFINFKTETLARYLIDRHADGCALSLSVQDLKRLSEMQSLMEGGSLPNVNLLDSKDQPQDLKRYATKNRYTIVYVWISWCVKCQGQSPKIVSLYEKLRKKGLGVFAISLDETKEDWLTALEKLDANYPNVCELVPIKNSSVAPRYGISTTPKIFIIDKEGKIVAKDIYGDALERIVGELFSSK
ncbi:MAG: redoxin domain-containing protein [Flavobacteriales bacterium]|nr:redoxin domain-containing protein [Flavobacteriales bacterium]